MVARCDQGHLILGVGLMTAWRRYMRRWTTILLVYVRWIPLLLPGLVVFDVLLRIVGLRRSYSLAICMTPEARRASVLNKRCLFEIDSSLRAISRHFPFSCLRRSLVLLVVLRLWRVPCDIRIEANADGGHAWVEIDGVGFGLDASAARGQRSISIREALSL